MLDRHRQATGATLRIDFDGERGQPFGKADPLLQRFFHLLVVERVRRAVDQSAAIGDGDAAPAVEQLENARRASFVAGALAFRA